MKITNNNSSTAGIGFCPLLTIIFVIAKLMNVISWSWWWVFSPLWLPLAVVLGIAVTFILFKVLITKDDF